MAQFQADVEVLTIAETAAYLRVTEEAVLQLIAQGALPAQLIGNEWRLHKQTVADWLLGGNRAARDPSGTVLPTISEQPSWEALCWVIEQRVLSRLPKPNQPAPASKEAVLRQFGAMQGDGDLDEQLAHLQALRESVGE